MNRIEQIVNQIKANERTYREIQIEKILGEIEENKSTNQRFIDEVRDYLSTIINRSTYINIIYFVDTDVFSDIPTCNCKTTLATQSDFIDFMKVLYSLYKQYEDFDDKKIITEHLREELI